MTSAVIVSTARTPLAKSWKGAFNMTHGATLGGHAIEHAVKRAGIEAGEVEDVIMGCANPEGATGWNIARQAALRAGLPDSVSAVTVNRFLRFASCSNKSWVCFSQAKDLETCACSFPAAHKKCFRRHLRQRYHLRQQ